MTQPAHDRSGVPGAPGAPGAPAVPGSWEWHLADDAVRCSVELLRLCGRAPREARLPLAEFVQLVHEADRDALRDALARARDDGHAFALELRIVHADARVRHVDARGLRVTDAHGAPTHVAGTVQDVTERREIDDRLRQAQKAEAVGRLAAGIAHDFNNLLTSIRCSAELVRETLDPRDDRAGDVGDILTATDRAAALTRQLLAFARQQVLAPRVLDLNALVTDFAAMMRRTLHDDIEQVLSLDPAAGHVRADRDQLQQMLLNLAMNARDAMPEGGVLLVHTSNVTLDEHFGAAHPGVAFTPGPYVELTVSDTGRGMDAATRERIFEPFFTTKARGEATGLGLSTVYGIVKQSGGFIWAASEPNRGTRFSIYLPRVEAPVEGTPTGAPRIADRGSETVLVVEDEPLILGLACRVLRAQGYTVLGASGGEEALAIAAAHDGPIDLLLSDVVMPRLGGPALASRLAATRGTLRVLYMSGYTEGEIVQQHVLRPGVHLIEKPFTPRQLVERVRRALDGG